MVSKMYKTKLDSLRAQVINVLHLLFLELKTITHNYCEEKSNALNILSGSYKRN